MDLRRRINAFLALGESLRSLPLEEKEEIFRRANYHNPWFTDANLNLAFNGLIRYLDGEQLEAWLTDYDLSNLRSKRVGVVMAGNIPMVGIHDFICVLISGHSLVAKLSSQDEVLIRFIAQKLIDVEPEYQHHIFFAERLTEIDAVIATGSDNTSRYFQYYFSKYPHIIRKNRTSVAVLTGYETDSELTALGDDIFSYFGMGCRNVSTIFLPEGDKVEDLFHHWEGFKHLADHHKYANNYQYQRTIMLVNQQVFLDNGFCLFVESDRLVSPLAVVYYSFYSSIDDLKNLLSSQSDRLQCIVSRDGLTDGSKKIGTAQTPEIMDYADNVDTLKFLLEI